jgi:hypothetical protein
MDGAGTGSLSCRTSSIAGLVYPLLDAFCAAMCAGLGSSWSQLCVGDTVFCRGRMMPVRPSWLLPQAGSRPPL